MASERYSTPEAIEKHREQSRDYYRRNREKALAQKKATREADPEAHRERSRAWRAANPDKVRAWDRARNERDGEKRKTQARARYALNIDKMRAVAVERYHAARAAGKPRKPLTAEQAERHRVRELARYHEKRKAVLLKLETTAS